jgi:NAD(P)H-hydrate epimerase
MMGAAQLAIKACLRSGVGLVTAHIPRKGVDIIQTTCPEAVCSIDNDDYYFSEIADCSCFSAIGVGCGIAQNSLTKAALKDLLLLRRPLVLDADALNIIAANNWTTSITPNSILTPHPKEFARLFGESPNSYQQLLLLQQKAVELKCIILLKGVFTAIALPDNTVYFNTTGNNGLAKGGSGDVLTGLILGLVAQGYTPEDAARLGAYQHGRAADIAASMLGQKAMLPSDLMHYFDAATE